MSIGVDESVGSSFNMDRLQAARDLTLQVIQKAAEQMTPGMTEQEGRDRVLQIQREAGAPKSWHPPQIRFGSNTVLSFGMKSELNPILEKNDLFFFDIGPIFDGHEGDVGRTFSIGGDPDRNRCCRDVEEIWKHVRNHWRECRASGPALYAFARKEASDRGWLLNLKGANGHRIADFPHAARSRGTIEGYEGTPSPNRWILEIQIRHPTEAYGAFFEDLLN